MGDRCRHSSKLESAITGFAVPIGETQFRMSDHVHGANVLPAPGLCHRRG